MLFNINWKHCLTALTSSVLLLLVSFAEPSITSDFNQVAHAATLSQSQLLLDIPSPSEILDEVAGAGASNRVEGTKDRVVGKAKRDISEVSGVSKKAEGLAQEATGKAKQDVAKVQTKIDEVADDAANLYDEMSDSVREKL